MSDKSPLVSRSKCNGEGWRKGWLFEVLCLSLTTLILIATFIVNGLAAAPDPSAFGFEYNTGNVSNEFYNDVTPAGWTFSIWGLIYAAQAIWILYAWMQVFRPRANRTIFPGIYLIYAFTNTCNIIWLYLWGNGYVQAAFPFLFCLSISLWCSFGVQSFYLNRIAAKPPTDRLKEFKIDYYLTQFVVINGMVIYDTWTTVATLINLAAVIQYYGNVDGTTVGTIILSILTIEVVVYFILEAILDQLHRFVFIVYPVIIWALSGVLSAQGIDKRNGIFTAVLLALTCLLFVLRGIMWIIFAIYRPQNSTRLFSYKEVA